MADAPTTWILTGSPETRAATRERGPSPIGTQERRRPPAQRMAPADRIVPYPWPVAAAAGVTA